MVTFWSEPVLPVCLLAVPDVSSHTRIAEQSHLRTGTNEIAAVTCLSLAPFRMSLLDDPYNVPLIGLFIQR